MTMTMDLAQVLNRGLMLSLEKNFKQVFHGYLSSLTILFQVLRVKISLNSYMKSAKTNASKIPVCCL